MTTIVYAITLRNEDGTTATAATRPMEYPAVPSEHLQAMVAQNVANLEQSHQAMLDIVKQREASPARRGVAQTFARKARAQAK